MPRRILEGIVVSAKTNKTLTVKVERKFSHPLYKKIIKVTKKYKVHNPVCNYKEGDFIKIEECRPISKTKNWIVLEKDKLVIK